MKILQRQDVGMVVKPNPDWKELFDICNSISRKAGWTKKENEELIKSVREKNNTHRY